MCRGRKRRIMLVALKLLVVDDDGPTLKLMRKVLTSVKAEVRSLRDGEQALTLVNHERFDVFVDLQMPKKWMVSNSLDRSGLHPGTSPPLSWSSPDKMTRKPCRRCSQREPPFFCRRPIDRQRLTNLFKAARGKMFENRRQFARVPLQTEVICQVGD